MKHMRKTEYVLNKVAAILIAFFLVSAPVMMIAGFGADIAFAAGNEAHNRLDENGYDKNENDDKTPTEKARDASNYYIFDVEGIFGSDGSSDNKLWDGMVKILQIITTSILLPIAIVLTTWRTAYIATLVYIGHVDPLHMVFTQTGALRERYAGKVDGFSWMKRKGGYDWGSLDNFTNMPTKREYEYANTVDQSFRKYKRDSSDWAVLWNSSTKRALLVEVKNMGIGLFIVFAVWSLINVMIWLATILLNFAGETGGDVMTDGSILQAFHLLM